MRCNSPATPRIALLVETSLAPGREILRGVARYMHEHRPWLVYHTPHALRQSVPRWLRRWRGDGIIARVQTQQMAEEISTLGIPIVDVLGAVPETPFPLVHVDNAAIAHMAAQHFRERGFHHFAFVGIENENWSQQRYISFRAALPDICNDLPLYEFKRRMLHGACSNQVEIELANWTKALKRPSAVFVCSDQAGPLFLKACKRAQVRVPEDIAAIGVDNDEPLCEVCSAPLSSIDPGHAGVGYEAARLLDSIITGINTQPQDSLLVAPRKVVSRRSSDILAIDDLLVVAALRLIQDHAHEGLRVQTIADRIGLSRSGLQRRFRAAVKCSIHQEIQQTKLRRARDMLIGTKLSLATIAERSGFRHQEYMSAVFKAHFQQTPGQVRASYASPRMR